MMIMRNCDSTHAIAMTTCSGHLIGNNCIINISHSFLKLLKIYNIIQKDNDESVLGEEGDGM